MKTNHLLENTLEFMRDRLAMLVREQKICQEIIKNTQDGVQEQKERLAYYNGMIEDAKYHISLIQPLVSP